MALRINIFSFFLPLVSCPSPSNSYGRYVPTGWTATGGGGGRRRRGAAAEAEDCKGYWRKSARRGPADRKSVV